MILNREDKFMLEQCFKFLDTLQLTPSEIFFNKVLDVLSKTFRNDEIHLMILNIMHTREVDPSLITFNTLMDIYAVTGDFQKCMTTFAMILKSEMIPDGYSFSMLLKALKNGKNTDFSVVNRVLEMYQETDLPENLVATNSMIDIYLFMNKSDEAEAMFKSILDSKKIAVDNITFSIMIKGCCRNKNYIMAMKYYNLMKESFPDLKKSKVLFNSLLDLSVKEAKLADSMQIFTEMQNLNITPDSFTYSIMLNALKQSKAKPTLMRNTLLCLKKILSISNFKQDEVFFNSVLDVCSKYEMYALLNYFYSQMKLKRVPEGSITYGILIQSYGKQGDFQKAESLFTKMVKENMRINDITYGCILDACAKSGKMDTAVKIYQALAITGLNLNSIVFTTIIKGYLKHDQCQKALDFFAIIKAHTNLAGMVITYNCALDVMVKMEIIDEAIELFETIDTLY